MPPPAARPTASAQRWLRVAIVVSGSVTFVCFLGLSPLLRSITRRDREASPPRVGVAVVEQIVPPHIEEDAKPIPAQVWVRVNGTLAAAETVYGSSRLRVGGPAQVKYRIGKSGRIYVDSVEPMP